MRTRILFLSCILLLLSGCINKEGLPQEDNIAKTGINENTEIKDTGYIVDYQPCSSSFGGYYIISENLKDTLLTYNLLDFYETPLDFGDGVSHQYEYKIEFTYTIAKDSDYPLCTTFYNILYPYAKHIIIKSVYRL
jgi:hypothetical protein